MTSEKLVLVHRMVLIIQNQFLLNDFTQRGTSLEPFSNFSYFLGSTSSYPGSSFLLRFHWLEHIFTLPQEYCYRLQFTFYLEKELMHLFPYLRKYFRIILTFLSVLLLKKCWDLIKNIYSLMYFLIYKNKINITLFYLFVLHLK